MRPLKCCFFLMIGRVRMMTYSFGRCSAYSELANSTIR